MEIVNIEASAFMEMNDILFKIEKQLKGVLVVLHLLIVVDIADDAEHQGAWPQIFNS